MWQRVVVLNFSTNALQFINWNFPSHTHILHVCPIFLKFPLPSSNASFPLPLFPHPPFLVLSAEEAQLGCQSLNKERKILLDWNKKSF